MRVLRIRVGTILGDGSCAFPSEGARLAVGRAREEPGGQEWQADAGRCRHGTASGAMQWRAAGRSRARARSLSPLSLLPLTQFHRLPAKSRTAI